MDISVRPDGPRQAVLDWGRGGRRAAIGIGGIGNKRAEGDGITPVGRFAFRRIWFRADRMTLPVCALAVTALAPDDGWCDAPGDAAYNRHVKRPHAAGCETLWRDDALYDLIVELGFNDDPVVPGAGSAIFLHVARPDYGPTQGCVALALNDLLEAVSVIAPGDSLLIRS